MKKRLRTIIISEPIMTGLRPSTSISLEKKSRKHIGPIFMAKPNPTMY